MKLSELKADRKALQNVNNRHTLCVRIKEQVRSLSKGISKSDKMPSTQEHIALNRILTNLDDSTVEEIHRNVDHLYKDIYLTNLGKVRYLSFNLNKASRHLGINKKHPNIMNIAHNVLIHRFGLGVHSEILDVHSKIVSIDNTPIINIIIKYL